jgi:hypothetical protein
MQKLIYNKNSKIKCRCVRTCSHLAFLAVEQRISRQNTGRIVMRGHSQRVYRRFLVKTLNLKVSK